MFSTNEDGLCYPARMTFSGNIKGCVTLSLSLSLSLSFSFILAEEQININMRRAHSIFGPLFSLENHSFIIYSFLLDQLILEASSWMLYPCSNICNCFLPFVQLTQYRVIFQAGIKVFGTHQYSRRLICFTPFLNIIRQKDQQFAFVKVSFYSCD